MKPLSLFSTIGFAALMAVNPALAQSKYQVTPSAPFILFIFAPNPDSKPANAEYDMLQANARELDRSGVEQVFVIGDGRVKLPPPDARTEDGAALRKRYHVDANAFRLVLVAPSGSEKIRWSEPVDPRQILLHASEMPRPKEDPASR